MTLLVVTRAAPIGAARLGFLICLAFLAIFGLMVLVGEQRHRARIRAQLREGDSPSATRDRPPSRG